MPERALARSAFRRVLFWSVVLPVLLMAALAVILVWQIGRLRENARWVEQIDRIISNLNRMERVTVDLETGVRGFLITGDDRFLEPFTNGTRDLDPLISRTAEMLADRPEEANELEVIRQAKDEWQRFAEQRIAQRRANDPAAVDLNRALMGKELMDRVRSRYTRLIDAENDLRASRSSDVAESTRSTVIIACGAAILLGLAIGILSRGQIHWLTSTYERALRQSRELSASLEARVEERTSELSVSNAQLGEANKELEAFAYSVSHDLRAPMRHITGFADLLRKSPNAKSMNDEDRENLDIIHSTAILAGRMVDDLLAFSRVGRTQLRMSDVDVASIVQQCISELAPETKGRRVEWKIGTLLPTRGDAALIKMVFQNLLGNAVKYTQPRDVAHVEVSSTQETDGVTYVVRDNGVGFDMAYVHKLFGVFQRLHRSEEFEGTGIGLANVRRIIVRHGGHVWAEGIQGAGAAFYVRLPI